MTEIVIRDVPIIFPCKPYKVQEDYMNKVLECLQQGVNGVLESPTGTGKTLSLLCASLAWLQMKKAQLQANAQGLLLNNDAQQYFQKSLQSGLEKSAGPTPESKDTGGWGKLMSSPTIIYASRTHSQLVQVMKELKRTNYSHVKATVLGSRDQLCINPSLQEEHGFMKVTLCRMKLKSRQCHYFNNLDQKKNNSDKSFLPVEVSDIEDLVKVGHKTQCCPYFMAREMMEQADIVFMPYNYLLDPNTRRSQRISLHNAVVILDEGHNVEKTCEEAASVHISSTDVALCIAEVTQGMKMHSENEKACLTLGQDTELDFSAEELCIMKTMFLTLETVIDDLQLDKTVDNYSTKMQKTFPGSYIFDLLAKAEITRSNLPVLVDRLGKLVEFISTSTESNFTKKGGAIVRFCEFLNIINTSDRQEADLFYKVHIEQETPKKSKPNSWSSTNSAISPKAKVINYWCFSPAFAMKSMMSQGVHCVILTSGTLSPLQATVAELGIPVPVTLENPHIIKPEQVSVAIMSKGPTGEKLISNYSNRENPKYLGDLGRILTNFCRVIPDGILVFFASYPMMDKTINLWQQEGYWSQINAVKPLFVEPSRRDGLDEVMREYRNSLEVDGSRGAVLLAVLRGKVSEGVDFADAQARAVIITGLPYPPFKDPRVVLKQQYLDLARKTNPQGLTGRQWYELDAVRAVNQAVGRVIRHAHDFGAILLCDSRFESSVVTNALSVWLRSHLIKCHEFGPAYAKVSKFFKSLGLNPPLPPVQVGASFDCMDAKLRTKQASQEDSEKSKKENRDSSMLNFLVKFKSTQPKVSSQLSPQNFFDALDVPTSQKTVDIKKSVFVDSTDVIESFVQPAPKKRKLKIEPLKFTVNSVENSEHSSLNVPNASSAEYLLEVKKSLSTESFTTFKNAVKAYASIENEASYEKTVTCLRKIFPGRSTQNLFIGFKRYVKSEHRIQFEDLCLRLFGSVS